MPNSPHTRSSTSIVIAAANDVLERAFAHLFRAFDAKSDRERLVVTLLCAVVIGYFASLCEILLTHIWIVDARGHPQVRDFVAFWTAGREALLGHALEIYDPHFEHSAEVSVIGHAYDTTLGWSYPPLFIPMAALLARLPYVVAFLSWDIATLAFYAAVVARIAKRRTAFLAAIAAPWVLMVVWIGQNGFLTAALAGTVLIQLERKPILSGLVLSFLSYKPQFGILFPFALAAGGYWRTFAWAALGTLAWNVAAGAIFGFATFGAFFHALVVTTQTHLIGGGVPWWKLQSAYGLSRSLGGSATAAWTAQAFASAVVVVGVVATWRTKIPFALRAALLAAGIPLATPYVFVYDMPLIAIAVAYLFRHRPFDKVELALLAVAVSCVFTIFLLPLPGGFFSSVAVAAIAVRRCYFGTSDRNVLERQMS